MANRCGNSAQGWTDKVNIEANSAKSENGGILPDVNIKSNVPGPTIEQQMLISMSRIIDATCLENELNEKLRDLARSNLTKDERIKKIHNLIEGWYLSKIKEIYGEKSVNEAMQSVTCKEVS